MSEPIGVGLIGTGMWGKRLAAAIQRTPSLRLVASFSRDAGKNEAFAAEFGCEAAPSFEAAVGHAGVRGGILATPNSVHAEQAQALAELGKGVFVEKPIADTLDDGLQIKNVCEQAAVPLLVGHAFRRLGASRKAKQLLDEGVVGKVVLAEANFSLPGTLTPDKWRYYRETCPGGPLMQLGIHHVDTLHYWLGPVVSVHARFAHLHTEAEIDDITSTQLVFQNGAVGTLNCSYVSPKTFDLRVYGTEGVLDYHTDMSVWPHAPKMDEATKLRLWTKTDKSEIAFESKDMIAEELDEFARCISGETRPETGGQEGLNALQVVLAAVESAETGQTVSLAS